MNNLINVNAIEKKLYQRLNNTNTYDKLNNLIIYVTLAEWELYALFLKSKGCSMPNKYDTLSYDNVRLVIKELGFGEN